MAVPTRNSTLADVLVSEAMRRQVPHLTTSSSISDAIKYLIKYKISGLLIKNELDEAVGVVSKTDIVSAYYAGLPIETTLGSIMVGPPLFCSEDESLESALDAMRSNMVYRLYVKGSQTDELAGVIAYPDIVALLYVYCRGCEQSAVNRRKNRLEDGEALRFRVRDVMTSSVVSYFESDTLSSIIEGMSQNRFSAVLIRDDNSRPVGVISKTDLMLAFNHGVDVEQTAKSILGCPSVRSCDENEFIEDAISEMVFSELHRLFVHGADPSNITGVLSLSDVSRLRSGSCHACVGARITMK